MSTTVAGGPAAAAGLLLTLALLACWPAGSSASVRRLARILDGAVAGQRLGADNRLGARTSRWLAKSGLVTGARAMSGSTISRLKASQTRRRGTRSAGDDAVAAIDLLAACVASGCGVDAALAVVADVSSGPVAEMVRAVSAALRLGAPMAEAVEALDGSALEPLGRVLGLSATSGSSVAATLRRLAEDQRSEQRWRAEARARRVGTFAALPVTLCFLPAFIAVGVVPVVIGMGAQVLGG